MLVGIERRRERKRKRSRCRMGSRRRRWMPSRCRKMLRRVIRGTTTTMPPLRMDESRRGEEEERRWSGSKQEKKGGGWLGDTSKSVLTVQPKMCRQECESELGNTLRAQSETATHPSLLTHLQGLTTTQSHTMDLLYATVLCITELIVLCSSSTFTFERDWNAQPHVLWQTAQLWTSVGDGLNLKKREHKGTLICLTLKISHLDSLLQTNTSTAGSHENLYSELQRCIAFFETPKPRGQTEN